MPRQERAGDSRSSAESGQRVVGMPWDTTYPRRPSLKSSEQLVEEIARCAARVSDAVAALPAGYLVSISRVPWLLGAFENAAVETS